MYPRFTRQLSAQWHGPLKLELTVHQRPPTADEFRLLLPLQAAPSFTEFLSQEALPTLRETPTNAQALAELVARRPKVLNWPVVVDWEHEECSLGGKKYTDLLAAVARRRKKVMKPEPTPRPPPTPPEPEWIDYP
jgi:hypothetical protein